MKKKSTRYDTHVYPSTLERFKQVRKILKKHGTKITMTKIFVLLNDQKEERKKEAADKDVFLAVLINRDINELLDLYERGSK